MALGAGHAMAQQRGSRASSHDPDSTLNGHPTYVQKCTPLGRSVTDEASKKRRRWSVTQGGRAIRDTTDQPATWVDR